MVFVDDQLEELAVILINRNGFQLTRWPVWLLIRMKCEVTNLFELQIFKSDLSGVPAYEHFNLSRNFLFMGEYLHFIDRNGTGKL